VIKGIAAVVAGFIVWWVVATAANLLMRVAWPAYADVEKALTFTTAMMAARLAVGALSSLCAGVVAAWLTKKNGVAVNVLVVALVALFVPVHYSLWNTFPLWYHAIFFASLVVVTFVGAAWFVRGARPQPVR